MADDDSFIRRHYADEYFTNSSEPHRRRPAIVDVPCTVWHVGVYHGEDEERAAFVATMTRELPLLLKGWRVVRSFSQEPPGATAKRFIPLTPEFLADFFNQGAFTGQQPTSTVVATRPSRKAKARAAASANHPARDTVFCFECVPPGHARWTLRFDLHSEYFTFTMFTTFEVEQEANHEVLVRTFHWSKGHPDELGTRRYRSAISRAEGRKPNPIRALLNYGFVAPPDLPEGVEAGPICQALRAIIRASGKNVFCDFRGIVTDWRLFTPLLETRDAQGRVTLLDPGLCPESLAELPSDHDHSCTQKFLVRIWRSLADTVFAKASENLVGCYMQNGHTLYLSALGAQGLPPSAGGKLEPLTFLVIFDKPSNAGHEGNPHRWRLSRLLNRLIEVGTRRLASLRNLEKLRAAGNDIRRLEAELDTTDRRSRQKYGDLEGDLSRLDDIHNAVDRSLVYRVGRAGKHYQTMMTLMEDLGVRKVPGWLPYDQFVKRRLSGTQEEIARLMPRIRALEEGIRVRLQLLDTKASRGVEFLAMWTAIIGLLGAIGLAVAGTELLSLVEAVAPWLAAGIPADLLRITRRFGPDSEQFGMLIGIMIGGVALGYFLRRDFSERKQRRLARDKLQHDGQ